MKPKLKNGWAMILFIAMAMAGCDMMSAYRPADIQTIQDFSESGHYRKRIGVMALTNTTAFVSDQAVAPFMESFLSGMTAVIADAPVVRPGRADTPSFLLNPPRLPSGEVDAFAFAALARQAGMNMVASPVLMDIRVYKESHGFWIFRTVSHHLRIQAVAVVYDAITGSRLILDRVTEEIDIDEHLSNIIAAGQEAQVPGLGEALSKMGATLGERMGQAIDRAPWLSSVIAVENGLCIIPAGSQAGLAAGDRLVVIDGSEVVAGWNEQRYTAPGLKTGEICIRQVTPDQSFAAPEAGSPPPAGSIVTSAN